MKAARTIACSALSAILAGLIRGNNSAEPAGPAAVPGLIGRYYADAAGDEPVCVRIDPGVAFDWSDGMPDDRLPEGDFKVTWEGLLRVPYAAEYEFTARTRAPCGFGSRAAGCFRPRPLIPARRSRSSRANTRSASSTRPRRAKPESISSGAATPSPPR